jgi:HEAT repeat protein
MRIPFLLALLSPWLLVYSSPGLARADFDPVIDSPMYQAPDLPGPPTLRHFPEKAKELWLRALERPDADSRRQVADAVALAHRRGYKGMESTAPALISLLDQPDQHPAVRLAAARTLIELDAKEAAATLWKQSESGDGDLRDLVEPALARWKFETARAVWLKRLEDEATPPRRLVLAVRGIVALHEGQAVERLRALTLSEHTPRAVRDEAAHALGALRSEGLETDAESLTADATIRGVPARLAAVALLHQHQSKDTVRLLQRLVDDPEPAVAGGAVARLLEIDPELVVSAVDRALDKPEEKIQWDARLRALGVEALHQRPTTERVGLLAKRLADLDLAVRVQAGKVLADLAAQEALHAAVLERAAAMLATNEWRGQEQAAILLAQLDHKPAAKRLLELLPSPRPEVRVSAAWGLRKLAVAETKKPVADFVDTELSRVLGHKGIPDPTEIPNEVIDHQFSQLNQFLGEQDFVEAESLLRRFIPRMDAISARESRAAAIWALGRIYKEKPDAALAKLLEARLNDTHSIPPENRPVRRMSAVALGRMQAKDSVASLRANYPEKRAGGDPVNNACGWAIEQITGEPMAPAKTLESNDLDFFLTPRN